LRSVLLVSLAAWALGCGARHPPTEPSSPVAVAPPEAAAADPDSPQPRAESEPPSAEVLEQARALLGEIGRSAQMAFQREERGPKGRSVSGKLCPSSQPVPLQLWALAPSYHSTDADWLDDLGWRCLKLSVEEPLRCQLAYASDAEGFTATARCPGSGMIRELWLTGHVAGRDLRLSERLEERDIVR
jgi:hypothetical protein